jgi:hypothetical protein
MLKATVTALRDELENVLGGREMAIQTATLNLEHEISQLRETVQVLRAQMDLVPVLRGPAARTR